MPELPEVETVARVLHAQLVGKRFVGAEIFWPGAVATPAAHEFGAQIAGRRIEQVTRRGKFVVMSLQPRSYMLVHLRMTGCLLVCDVQMNPQCTLDPYTRAILHLDSGQWLRFRDTRKFGRLYLVDDVAQVAGHLGPEPLSTEFTVEALWTILQDHRRRIKPLLSDQRLIAGLGNIYIDEALWEAGIHPLRLAHTLTREEAERLWEAIRHVLNSAIANMGTTLRNYRTPDDQPGENEEALRVYGRKGRACPRCGHPIERLVVGQRGTSICPYCQGLTIL